MVEVEMCDVKVETPSPVADRDMTPRVEIAVDTDAIAWGAVIAGTITAIVVLLLLMLFGLGVALSTIAWHAYRQVLEALIVWGGLSAILASFAGGIVSGISSCASRRHRLTNGAATGALLVTLMSVAALTVILRWGDLTSVGVELGYIPIPDDAPLITPVPVGSRIIPSDAVTFTATASAWYALLMLALIAVATILGAWATAPSSPAGGTAASHAFGDERNVIQTADPNGAM